MAQRYPNSLHAFDRVTLHRCVQCRSCCCAEPVAEHAVALVLVLSPHRNIHRAFNRVREGNFEPEWGLVGFNMARKTVGIVGTGKITALARIVKGFDCKLLRHDS